MAYGGYLEWVSKHIFAKPLANKLFLVDATGIGGRNMLLPGEVSVFTSWRLRSNAKDVIFNQQRP